MSGIGNVMIESMDEQFRRADTLGWDLQHTVESAETERVRWHIRRVGRGPVVLLLHGTGASSHSFCGLAAALSTQAELIAPDLPGHGLSLTDPQFSMSLPAITNELEHFLERRAIRPDLIIGHSAGAAIAANLVTRLPAKRQIPVLALNGAFLPYGGIASKLLGPVARIASSSRMLAASLARRANDLESVRRMIAGTGSVLDDAGLRSYQALFMSPEHVRSTLRMMANWDLKPLLKNGLTQLTAPLALLVGELDSAVAPSQAAHIAQINNRISVHHVGPYGHLMHEEKPLVIAEYVVQQLIATDGDPHV